MQFTELSWFNGMHILIATLGSAAQGRRKENVVPMQGHSENKKKKGNKRMGEKSPFRITHCKTGAPYVSEELAAFQAFNFYFGFFLLRIFIALSFTCKNIQWYFKRISVSSVSLLISTLQPVLPQFFESYFFSEMTNENFYQAEMDLSDEGKQRIVLTSQMHLSVFL